MFKITVGDMECFLKKPTRKTLAYASSFGTKDPIEFNEIFFSGGWLGGDEEIKTRDDLFLSTNTKLAEVIEVKEAEDATL